MLKIARIWLVAAVLLVGIGGAGEAAPVAGSDTIAISPEVTHVAFGQTFSVDVRIAGPDLVVASDVSIPFDTSYLTGSAVTSGGAFSGYFINGSDLPSGKIQFAGGTFGSVTPPFTHATLTFVATQKLGVTPLAFTLSQTTIESVSGSVMSGAYDGQVTVGPNVSLNRSAATVAGCGSATVDLLLSAVDSAKSADVTLTYDATKLVVVDQDASTPGTQIAALNGFLKPDTVTANLACNALDPLIPACDTPAEVGTLHYAATQAAAPWATGSGAIARITFRPVGNGASALDIKTSQVLNNVGAAVAHTESDSSLQASALGAPSVTTGKISATTARLSWGAVGSAQAYRVYRKTAPYGAAAEPAYAATAALQWDDTGALGSTAQEYYYFVKAACSDGFAPNATSNQAGAFDYGLVKGS